MTLENATSEGSTVRFARAAESPFAAICVRQVTPDETTDPGPRLPMTLTYCGSCRTLHLAPARADGPAGHGLAAYEEVAAPADEQTLEGQFQLRCRDLIGEIRSLGFNPNVWVAMINSLGAAGAARKLLGRSSHAVVTPWLGGEASQNSR